jgi:hypothetical protein
MPSRFRHLAVVTAALVFLSGLPPASAATVVTDGDTYARIDELTAVLGNDLVERQWVLPGFVTLYARDKRTGLHSEPSSDFRLGFLDGTELTGEDFVTQDVTATVLEGGGIRLDVELALVETVPGRVIRSISVFPGIAGFEVRTRVEIPGVISSYVLDELELPGAAPEIHAFSAGYDWRGSDTTDWEPSASPFGGHHSGDHRETATAGAGEALEGEAEWMSLASEDGPRAFFVIQRVDYASTRMAYDGTTGSALVDLDHDLAYLGPFESDIHLANPGEVPARYRVVRPDRPLDLEPVFTGFALDADDEPWQHFRYVEGHVSSDWGRDVVFNSNGVDGNRISTGAKDDMDLTEVGRQADVAQRLGIETFVLDDGWQAASGDWCPDSPQCPEPRGLYPDRFPDADFTAVRAELDDMKFGLWMSPMQFNPAAEVFKRNPQWNCHPVGDALVAYNTVDPNGSSNEAGLGTWNPEATGPEGKLIEYIERRIAHAIDNWGVTYFKFDFMAWTDCAGVDPATAYDYRESFVRMLDRLIAEYPKVTFQIDETNDYRLFPFESAVRGPSWYANGHPTVAQALHNLWLLSPYVPAYTIGQAVYGQRDTLPNDYLMAAALTSHMTFFTDLTRFSDAQVDEAARWIEIYKANRDRLATFTYPLLEDPLPGDNWTALQPWNPETGRGALLAFRQDSPIEINTIALRGVRGDGSYRFVDAATGEQFGEFTADELRAGITVELPQRFSAAVLLIEPLL